MDAYRWLFRPILIGIDAERAHRVTLAACPAAERTARETTLSPPARK